MTGQINDGFRYRGHDVSLVEVRNGRLFDPAMLNMEAVAPNTACWRGYQARLALSGTLLVLETLHINLRKKDYGPKKGPAINGVKPRYMTDKNEWFNNQYDALDYRLDYTGSLLLGDGFIQSLYTHGGFQAAWKFEQVFELVFMDGDLKQEFDRSAEMAELRKLLIEEGNQEVPTSQRRIVGDNRISI